MYKWISIILLLFVGPVLMAQNNDQNSKSIVDDFYDRTISNPQGTGFRQIDDMHELLMSYSLQDQKIILFSNQARVFMTYITTALNGDRLDLIAQIFELYPIWEEEISFTTTTMSVGIYIAERYSAQRLLKLSQAGYDASHLERETIEKIALYRNWNASERKMLTKVFGFEIPDLDTIVSKNVVSAILDDIKGSKADRVSRPLLSASDTNKPSYLINTCSKETFKVDVEQFKNKIKDQMYHFINKTKPSPRKRHSFKFEQSFSSSCSVDSKFTYEFNNNNNELLIHSIDGSINKTSTNELKRSEVSQSLGL